MCCISEWSAKIARQTEEWLIHWDRKDRLDYYDKHKLLNELISSPNELQESFESSNIEYQQSNKNEYEMLMDYLKCVRYYIECFQLQYKETITFSKDWLDLKSLEEYEECLERVYKYSINLYNCYNNYKYWFPLCLATHIVYLKGKLNEFYSKMYDYNDCDNCDNCKRWAAARGHGPAAMEWLKDKGESGYVVEGAASGYVPCLVAIKYRTDPNHLYPLYLKAALLNHSEAINWCFDYWKGQKLLLKISKQKDMLQLVIQLLESEKVIDYYLTNLFLAEFDKSNEIVRLKWNKAWDLLYKQKTRITKEKENAEWFDIHRKEIKQASETYYEKMERFFYRPGGYNYIRIKEKFNTTATASDCLNKNVITSYNTATSC